MNGGAYQKVTSLSICEELLDRMRMIDYVEGYGNTVLCGLDGTNCNEKEINFIEKWKSKSSEEILNQMERLQEMGAKPMNDDLKDWVWRRMAILKKLSTSHGDDGGSIKEEL